MLFCPATRWAGMSEDPTLFKLKDHAVDVILDQVVKDDVALADWISGNHLRTSGKDHHAGSGFYIKRLGDGGQLRAKRHRASAG
jgi:hypothetical protein